jgi:hypothetical protein
MMGGMFRPNRMGLGINKMRIAIQADHGDRVSIKADVVSIEQALITLEIENVLYNRTELETVTLTIDGARELATALLSVAEAIEFVSAPTNAVERTVNCAPPSAN